MSRQHDVKLVDDVVHSRVLSRASSRNVETNATINIYFLSHDSSICLTGKLELTSSIP